MKKLESFATMNRIRDAFVDLLLEKEYQDISATEIASKSGINRTTFYMFYESKDALAHAIWDEFMDWYVKEYSLSFHIEHSNSQESFVDILKKIGKDAKFVEAMLKIKADGFVPYMELQNSIKILTKENIRENVSEEKADLIAAYYAACSTASMLWWLDNKDKYSPEELQKIVETVIMKGLHNFLE